MNPLDREKVRRYAAWLEAADEVELAYVSLRRLKVSAAFALFTTALMGALIIFDPNAGAFPAVMLSFIAFCAPFMAMEWRKNMKTVRDAK